MLRIFAAYGLVNSKQQALNLLGLSNNASEEAIKQAFKQKALKAHPDVGGTNENMQLLIAARDYLLAKPMEVEEPPNWEMSYEDIADLRTEMGIEEFNRKYQGWEGELKREMGLDHYNDIFEGYNPKKDNYYNEQNYERKLESIASDAADLANDLIDLAIDNKIFSLYLRSGEVIEKFNINLLDYVDEEYLDIFIKDLDESFYEKILKNLDSTKITLEEMMEYPNIHVIEAFLSDYSNKDILIPNEMLGSTEFCQAILFLLSKDPDIAKIYIMKYKDNNSFIDAMVECCGFYYCIRGNDKAIELLRQINFNPKQKSIVDSWLKYKIPTS